jgi:hypothetical protein
VNTMTFYYACLVYALLRVIFYVWVSNYLLRLLKNKEENSKKKAILAFVLGLFFFPVVFLVLCFGYLQDRFPATCHAIGLILFVGFPLSIIWMVSGTSG